MPTGSDACAPAHPANQPPSRSQPGTIHDRSKVQDLAETDEMALLELWAAGDRTAASVLVERHFDVVYRFLRHRAGTASSDLVQRTFLACLESRERLTKVVSFKAFLLGIARNLLLHHIRSEGARGRAMQKHREQSFGPPKSLGSVVALRREQKLLIQALRLLPIDLQHCLELHYWEGMTAAEIAQVLGTPRGTILTRLFRARKTLRKNIMALAEDEALATTTAEGLESWARTLHEGP